MSDLIKREDAIKAIEELPNAYNGWSDAYDKAYIIGTLEEVSSAGRPQGEWEDYDRYMKCCSKCGWIHDILHYGDDYCPHCGARMKGADDDTD